MTDLQVAAVAVTLLGAAVLAARRGRRPERVSVGELRDLLRGAPAARPRPGRRTRERIVVGLAARWAQRLGSDVALLGGRSVQAEVGRAITSGAVCAFAAALALGGSVAGGLIPLSPVWSVVVVAAGVIGAMVPIRSVAAALADARRDLRHAIADLLQLLAIGLTTDQSVEEAVEYAVAVGVGPGFELLRGELAAATARGLTVGEVLDGLGRRLDAGLLVELGSSIERQGRSGVSIRETVTAMAASARAGELDELERDADRANAALAGPSIAFVVTTVAFLAYPVAARIGEAFGG